ncbi:2-hydroxyacid dehydrogenase [Microbacterium sp.]|uniref:2-hydroxyacid dehydrogenase n=1 Tax=Microbacterium sp. TaxID=51671 RepID=UPI003A860318
MTRLIVSVPSNGLAADLRPLPDGVELVTWDLLSPPPTPRIDLVVLPYMAPGIDLSPVGAVQPRLVQSQSIGYEGVTATLPTGIVFANAATVHEASTAELAVGLALAAQRGIPGFVQAQERRQWEPDYRQSLADRRVLLLGYGGVGKAVAARLAPFEVTVTPVASRARDEDGIRVHGVDELPDLLPHADIVILTLPGGDATRHVIDDAALALLPDGALVVNVGRGPLIDTDALLAHAERGRIRAALDVTDPEPLPADHPLWALDGVLIVPHVGGASTAMEPRISALVRRQIDRMLADTDPENVVVRT